MKPKSSGGREPDPIGARLVRSFLNNPGNETFEGLHEHYAPFVFPICQGILARRVDLAWDAYQNTFVQLYRYAHQARNPDDIRPWLRQIACRAALDVKRKEARHSRQVACDSSTCPDKKTPSPEVQMLRKELDETMCSALNSLPEPYQTPMKLCYYGGMDARQIAQELQRNLDTVKSQLARGKNLLAARLLSRGINLSRAQLDSVLEAGPAPAAVPPALFRRTAEAVRRLRPGPMPLVVRVRWALEPLRFRHSLTMSLVIVAALLIASAGLAILSGLSAHDIFTGPVKPLLSLRDTDAPKRVALNGDGGLALIGAHDGKVKLIDVNAKQVRHTGDGHGLAVTCVSLTPDGAHAVSAGEDGPVKYWTLAAGPTGGSSETLSPPAPYQLSAVEAAAVSADGKVIAVAERDGTLTVWDLRHRRSAYRVEQAGRCVAVSPDGRLIALAGAPAAASQVRLWTVGGQGFRSLYQHDLPARTVRFTGDGQRLATVAADDTGGEVVIWDLVTGTEQARTRIAAMSPCVAVSGDGRLLATASPSATNPTEVNIYRTGTGKKVHSLRHGTRIQGLAFSDDNKRFAVVSADEGKVWDVQRLNEPNE